VGGGGGMRRKERESRGRDYIPLQARMGAGRTSPTPRPLPGARELKGETMTPREGNKDLLTLNIFIHTQV
jgi:hypothetical protein